jgi:hypothetical protein
MKKTMLLMFSIVVVCFGVFTAAVGVYAQDLAPGSQAGMQFAAQGGPERGGFQSQVGAMPEPIPTPPSISPVPQPLPYPTQKGAMPEPMPTPPSR